MHEDYEKQVHKNWWSRLDQERQDLSASVEAALEEQDAAPSVHWNEAGLDAGSQTPGPIVIPPRIRLQSRMLPVVPATEDGALSMANEKQPLSASERLEMLTQLAQDLTESFTPHGYRMPEMDPSPQRIEAQNLAATDSSAVESLYRSVPDTPPASARQRLAGRATRIRLEVVPAEFSSPLAQSEKKERTRLAGDEKGSSLVPAIELFRQEYGVTSARLPIVEVIRGRLEESRQHTLSGSGVFEDRQEDATITNKHITASSVVLVTLLANPGPVVVQYVTLQPRIGFTVHLTAPATTKTAFNYIVLVGELF